MTQQQVLEVKDLTKSCNDVLEKLGWKWKPEVGEWCIYKSEIQVISRKQDFLMVLPSGEEVRTNIWLDINQQAINHNNVTPVLCWERIEGLLADWGYFFRELTLKLDPGYYRCTLMGENGVTVDGEGKSRTKAVYEAVVALGKKLGEELE